VKEAIAKTSEQAPPFNSIEWIPPFGHNTTSWYNIFLSIPLNGFKNEKLQAKAVEAFKSSLSIPLNGFKCYLS